MFDFFKKKEQKAVFKRRFDIPEFAVEEIVTLVDGSDCILGRFRLWTRINELIPETKLGRWTLTIYRATTAFVEEDL